MADTPSRTWQIFCSYAEEDEGFFKGLRGHLSGPIRQKSISVHTNHETPFGADREPTIEAYLRSADLILLLISPSFMESDECYDRDMQRAMERHHREGTPVIPVIVRPCHWDDTPFAQLAPLPEDQPITDWPNADNAYFEVAKGILERVKNLGQTTKTVGAASTLDITRLPSGSHSYFTIRLPQRFPTEEDFARNLVYLAPNYVTQVRNFLQTKRRALLVGRAAAGKTAFALTLARTFIKTEHYRVAYKDASTAIKGEGLYWYEVMRARGRDKVLYVLDNCHLAEEEVNAFCAQWDSEPPRQAQCILIARTPTEQKRNIEGEDEYDNYFTLWAGETVTLRAQDVYWEILKQHYEVYTEEASNRHYENPEQDDTAELQRLHATNLLISRTLLEAWKEKGGYLSRVKREAAYKLIRTRYLTSDGIDVSTSLPILCALRSYEIPVHSTFIRALIKEDSTLRDEITLLRRRRILVSDGRRGYGTLYNLVFHPEEARLIFEASLSDNGPVSSRVIEQSLTAVLKKYLLTTPANYLQVYARLVRLQQTAILQHLLKDSAIQEQAQQQFEKGLLSEERLGSISKIIETMQQLGYTDTQLQLFIDALNVEQLLEYAIQKKENPQHLFWLLRSLRRVSPKAAIRILDTLTPEGLAALCLARKPMITALGQFSKIVPKSFWKYFLEAIPTEELVASCNRSPLGAVGAFMQHHYQHEAAKQGYLLFQDQFLKGRFIIDPLSEIGKFLHRLRNVAGEGPALAREAIGILPRVQLSDRLVNNDVEAFAVLLYETATLAPGDTLQLLQQFARPAVMHSALAQSSIHAIQLLIHNIARIEPALLQALGQELQSIPLKEKFAQASLQDMTYFLWNVHEYLDAQLAQRYCRELDEQLDPHFLREASMEELYRFLLNMYLLGPSSPLQIFSLPILEKRVAHAWEGEIELAAALLGILSLALPDRHFILAEPSPKAQQRLEHWLRSFANHSTYLFACTLYGLKAWNEAAAGVIVLRTLHYGKATQLLHEERKKAHNKRAISLAEHIHVWLKHVFAQ